MSKTLKAIIIKLFKKIHLTFLLIYSIIYTVPKLFLLTISKRKIKIEFGSGPFVYSKTRNQYLTSDRFFNCDLPWDARIPMPFLKGKVNSIYSSHFLEHLSFEELSNHFKYCANYLLKKNGNYIIAVPNAKLYLDAYYESRLSELIDLAWRPALPNSGSLIDQVNYIAYMNQEHKILFDKEFILNYLTQNGFNEAKEREFDPLIDWPNRHYESLYCIGYK